MDVLKTVLLDGGTFTGCVVGVSKAFEWLDGLVSDEGRQALTERLKSLPSDERIDSWATVFPNLIDRVFGPRAFSWTFFFRSCLASLIAVLFVFLLFLRLPTYIHQMVTLASRVHLAGEIAENLLLSQLLGVLIANFCPDYLSLVTSRLIVRMMVNRPTTSRVIFLLVIDTCLTAIIAWIGCFFLAAVRFELDRYSFVDMPGRVLSDDFGSLNLGHLWFAGDRYSVFFYSAFFTSVWVWIYVLSIYLISSLHRIRAIGTKLMPYLDIEKKPLIAIGKVAGLLTGLAYVCVVGITWVIHLWKS